MDGYTDTKLIVVRQIQAERRADAAAHRLAAKGAVRHAPAPADGHVLGAARLLVTVVLVAVGLPLRRRERARLRPAARGLAASLPTGARRGRPRRRGWLGGRGSGDARDPVRGHLCDRRLHRHQARERAASPEGGDVRRSGGLRRRRADRRNAGRPDDGGAVHPGTAPATPRLRGAGPSRSRAVSSPTRPRSRSPSHPRRTWRESLPSSATASPRGSAAEVDRANAACGRRSPSCAA
jgi:hypothetical protein